jgi:hypothetical protein
MKFIFWNLIVSVLILFNSSDSNASPINAYTANVSNIGGTAFLKSCNFPLVRTYTTVTTLQELEAISTFDCVIGGLELRIANEHVSLPNLKMVYGALIMRNTSALSFTASVLEEVNGSLFIELNKNVLQVHLPKLGSLNGIHRVQGNISLQSLNFGALGAINGKMDIFGNSLLLEFNLRALGGVNGALRVWENHRLKAIRLNALATVNGQIKIASNQNLEFIGLYSLKTLRGALVVTHNPALSASPLLELANHLKIRNKLARVKIAGNASNELNYAIGMETFALTFKRH